MSEHVGGARRAVPRSKAHQAGSSTGTVSLTVAGLPVFVGSAFPLFAIRKCSQSSFSSLLMLWFHLVGTPKTGRSRGQFCRDALGHHHGITILFRAERMPCPKQYGDPEKVLAVCQHICYHKGVKSEEASGVTGLFPQTFPNQRGPAWSASNTLNITGMPGEVRAHGVPCHFPWCPISLLSCPVACSLKSHRKEPAHEAVLLQ
jgi:hypothetical protein